MNSEEREKLQYIMTLLRSVTHEFFTIQLSGRECSILVKYIDYLRGIRGDD